MIWMITCEALQNIMYNDVKNLADFYGEDQLFTGLVDAVASM